MVNICVLFVSLSSCYGKYMFWPSSCLSPPSTSAALCRPQNSASLRFYILPPTLLRSSSSLSQTLLFSLLSTSSSSLLLVFCSTQSHFLFPHRGLRAGNLANRTPKPTAPCLCLPRRGGHHCALVQAGNPGWDCYFSIARRRCARLSLSYGCGLLIQRRRRCCALHANPTTSLLMRAAGPLQQRLHSSAAPAPRH